MSITLPAEVPEDVRKLGEPIAEFKSGKGTFVFYVIVGVLGLLLGLAMLSWPLIELAQFAEKGEGSLHIGRAIIGGLALLSGGVAALVKASRTRGLRVFAFATGLAWLHKNAAEIMRWDEIAEVLRTQHQQSEGLTLRSPVQLTLTAEDGRTWTLDESVSRLRELRMLVEEHTLKRLFQRTRETCDAGETVRFGVIGVSREGILVGDKALPWDLLGEVTAERGRLTFTAREQGKPLGYVDLHQVPNAHVLLALVEHARAQ